MQKVQVQFLGREDPLQKEMATHSRIHAWKILWPEEPGGLQSMELQRTGRAHTCCISEADKGTCLPGWDKGPATTLHS